MQNNNLNSAMDLPKGVMLNAYPDSIGSRLSDIVQVLQKSEFSDVFSVFYILPTLFNSDLDRGFSVIDYNLNEALVSSKDLEELQAMGIELKLDIVLNHLSVASPQFQDVLQQGEHSAYKDFFIDWNAFWNDHGTVAEDGVVVPKAEYLNRLFMRKPGFPVLKIVLPDGSEKVYWNTFYQKVVFTPLDLDEITALGIAASLATPLEEQIRQSIAAGEDPTSIDFDLEPNDRTKVIRLLRQKCTYLGQMDVNAESPLVWDFYKETLEKLSGYGCRLLRLDAFAYLHKEIGRTNFFNAPGTWDYLERIRAIADQNKMAILPEIHAEYGAHLHDQLAEAGHAIYDFFFPGLVLHTLEESDCRALRSWVEEILAKGYRTVHMLGCHDGIPVLDLNGKEIDGHYQPGLLSAEQIDAVMDCVLQRGGRLKNIYDADGNKLSYYQINATFYSALGEDDSKMLMARALQVFMPGIPQVWYLDLFVGKNDYAAADRAGSGGHKEINRTNLSVEAVEHSLSLPVVQMQLSLLRLRNTHEAFDGDLTWHPSGTHQIHLEWKNGTHFAKMNADLKRLAVTIEYSSEAVVEVLEF